MPFADVVADVIAHLDPVDGVSVSSKVPSPRPDEFIQIRRIGGPGVPPVTEVVRLDVFTWADTGPRAMELLGLVRESIWALAGGVALGYVVYGVVEFMGPTQSDDTETSTPRGWYRPELTVRADAVIHS
ncbi:MAG: hypothetical protein GY925_10405 [Actinomycetia bacterium]|nr:hypothetical protein [Actinomycetes bacterium]